jgi:hypothetical protein
VPPRLAGRELTDHYDWLALAAVVAAHASLEFFMQLSRGHRRKLSRLRAKAARCIDQAATGWQLSLDHTLPEYARELHRGTFHHRAREALPIVGRERFTSDFSDALDRPAGAAALAAIDFWADEMQANVGQLDSFFLEYAHGNEN